MTSQEDLPTRPFEGLRERAEAVLRGLSEPASETTHGQVRKLADAVWGYLNELETRNAELLQTQAELVASHRRCCQQYDFAPVGFVTTSEAGLILETNRTFADMVGQTTESLIGQSFSDSLDFEDQDTFFEFHRSVTTSGTRASLDVHLHAANGEPLSVRLDGITARDAQNGELQLRLAVTDVHQQRQTDRKLLREQAATRKILQSLPELFYMFKEGSAHFVRRNANFALVTEYSDEELDERTALDVVTDKELCSQRMQQVYDQGSAVMENGILTKSGREIPHFFTGERIVIDGEKYLVGLAIDISARLQAEQEARDSEEYLRSIFRAAPAGIGVVVDRVFLQVNAQLCEMTGYLREEIIGQSSRMLYPSDEDYEYVGREKYTQIRDHGTGTVETRWQCKSGRIIDVLLSSSPFDLNDLTKGVTFTALDITDRKHTEEALKASEAKYRNFFENSGDAMLMIRDYMFVDCNAATVMMLGYDSKEEVLDVHPASLSPEYQPDGRKSYDKAMEMMNIAQAEGTHRFEWYHKRRNAEVFPVEVLLTAIPTTGAMVLHVVWRELTERKREEEERKKLEIQLNQAQKMEAVGQLAGGIAHDFNNILQAILGYGELAMIEPDKANSLQGFVEEILKAAYRAKTLVSQLLAFSRRQVLEMQDLDLNEVVVELVKMLQRVIGEHIRLDIAPGHDIATVRADRGQIAQILTNLCVNSRDAMSGGGRITIKTENILLDEACSDAHSWVATGLYVKLSVRDTGCGMDEETRRQAFEPFFTTKEVGKGTGLGLSTVYGLVKQHDGVVEIDSQVGKGTTVSIYLPAVSRPASIGEKTEGPIPRGTETILLAEDDEMVRTVATSMLQQAGYTVLTAKDGNEAIDVFARHADDIDLALLDVVMPRRGGRAVFDEIRKTHPKTSVLFASGYSMATIHTNFVLDEGLALIQKPYQRADLLHKVREALDS